ncbi:MAG: transcription elongation factor GreA [Patescibacteria group bacterium]|nr:transcription elongation factor GreA [Patescibacteria group bacterium]
MLNQLTQQGFEKLKKELEELKNQKRPQAVERLAKARSMGDLSENSEYTAAKEELAFVEGRIQEIEEILKNAQVAENPSNDTIVELGETIVVEKNQEKITFTIVGEYEADPINGKISVNSPIGKGLIGKKVGEIVEIETPSGKNIYKILEIKKN